MADALTLAIVGVAGTVAVSLVTVVGTITSARIQARTAERNREREDAVRADERQTDTLQEVADSLRTRRAAPDVVERMMGTADEELRAFVGAARTIAMS